MIPLPSSEVAWYNGYSPTKGTADFQCITRNTDKIKEHAVFRMDVNSRLIT